MREIAKALVALCLVLFPTAVFAQAPGRLAPGTGIVAGSVQMEGGGSMAGVRVAVITVDDSMGANLVSLAETDAAGHFRLTDIPQGQYYVIAGRVSSPTYFPGGGDRTKATAIVVEPAKTVSNINFKVPADSRRPPPVQSTAAKSAAEFTAYQRASNEGNIFNKIKLLLSFEKSFPQSLLLPRAYEDLVDLYTAKGDLSAAMNYGDKLLEKEPDNVWALVKVSQAYGLAQINLKAARQYAERAVAMSGKLRTVPYPARSSEFRDYSAVQWTSMTAALDASTKSNLEWVNKVIVWNQNALNAALRTRR